MSVGTRKLSSLAMDDHLIRTQASVLLPKRVSCLTVFPEFAFEFTKPNLGWRLGQYVLLGWKWEDIAA